MKLVPITLAAVTLSAGAWAQTPQTASPPAQPPPTASQPTAPQTGTPPSPTAQMPAMDESHRINPDQIDARLAEGKVLLLDVREPKELEELGTIADSVNIPLGQLEKRLGELPKDRLILTA